MDGYSQPGSLSRRQENVHIGRPERAGPTLSAIEWEAPGPVSQMGPLMRENGPPV